LHFVKDQQDVAFIAVATNGTEYIGIAWIHAAFALERLDQHSANARAMGLEAV
jgi:hypothetical protein